MGMDPRQTEDRVLAPIFGADGVARIVARASAGEDLRAVLGEYDVLDGIDLDDLLDPTRYTGLAADLVDGVAAPPETHP